MSRNRIVVVLCLFLFIVLFDNDATESIITNEAPKAQSTVSSTSPPDESNLYKIEHNDFDLRTMIVKDRNVELETRQNVSFKCPPNAPPKETFIGADRMEGFSHKCDKGGAMWRILTGPMYAHIAESIASALALPRAAESHVLDLACGCGNVMQTLIQERHAAYVLGVDLNARAATFANTTLPRHVGMACYGDARHLDWLPERSLDGVVANALLGHIPLPDICPMLRAVLSKLVVGGVLYFGFISECGAMMAVMQCLDTAHVDVTITRDDHMYRRAFNDKLWDMKMNMYWTSPGIVIRKLSHEMRPYERQPNLKAPQCNELFKPYLVVHESGLGMQYTTQPGAGAGPLQVVMWGSCCSVRSIRQHKPCTATTPLAVYKRREALSLKERVTAKDGVLMCASGTLASPSRCWDHMVLFARRVCSLQCTVGSADKSCRRRH
eukprot:PhM_4_TR5610/c0_g1_i1/m.4011